MIETVEVEVPVEQQAEQKSTEQNAERQTSQTSEGEQPVASEDTAMADEQASNDAAAAGQQPQKMVKKKKTKAIDLTLTAKVPQLSKQEINNLFEQEVN